MMKLNNCFPKLLMVPLLFCTTILHAQAAKDSLGIGKVLDDEIDSWNKKDAAMYASHFAQNGTFTNLLGMFFTGYDNFLQKHAHVFKTVFRGTALKQRLVSIQFASADVAIVETITSVSGFSPDGPPQGTSLDSDGRLNTRLLQTMKRTGNEWKIIAYHNVDIKLGIAVPH